MQGYTRGSGLRSGAGRWTGIAAAAVVLGAGAGPAHASTLSNDFFLESAGVPVLTKPFDLSEVRRVVRRRLVDTARSSNGARTAGARGGRQPDALQGRA